MKIVGFGDSFIYGEHGTTYLKYIGDHFNTKVKARGRPGSGPWSMFFDFIHYASEMDVAIIVWSEISRLFHHSLHNLNTWTAMHITEGDPDTEIYEAARDFYKHLYTQYQKDWELRSLQCMFDELIVKKYPNTKFIQLPGFSFLPNGQWFGDVYKNITVDQLEYYYDFKNSVEIRPCLMWLSMEDDWPGDFYGDHRPNHLSPKYHTMLSKTIIHAIENYKPGEKLNIYDFA